MCVHVRLYMFFIIGEMNMKLDGLERSKAVQEMTSTFQDIMVSVFVYDNISTPTANLFFMNER